ncbi:MAG: GNAT family N-acetyltransferase [Verrucomicrobia bacterium]|nr:GNAT family N-acetyltransferase [Verrucomicrobiota bacterium]
MHKEKTSKFDHPMRQRFHEMVIEPLLEANFLRFYILEINGGPSAALYCYNYDDHVYYYQIGIDPAWKKMSIGLVLMGKAISASFAEKTKEFDFLRGFESYKLKWTSDTRNTFALEIAFGVRAKICFALLALRRQVIRNLKDVTKPLPQ